MMKIMKYGICFLSIFCISSGVFAQTQFNTARYQLPAETNDVLKEIRKEENIKKTKKESWIKRLFQRKKKTDLKKQIDSLKNLLIKQDKEHKESIYQMQNSLGQIIKKEVAKVAEKEKPKKRKKEVKVHMPLKMMFVTSDFGVRYHPLENKMKMHYGIDLKAKYERVYAVMNGQVIETGFDKKGGKFIKIAHSDKIETLYLHLSEIYYKKGDEVKAGFIIAKSGNTGNSTNPHLHFSVKDKGKYINPMKFLNQIREINNIINLNRYGKG